MMPVPTYRPSRFLHVCAAFTVLGALQVLVLPWLHTDFGGEWTIAWCSPRSELWAWGVLFVWTWTAAPILFFAVRSRVREAHVATIGAVGLFWLLAWAAHGFDRLRGADVFVPVALVAVMVWRYRRGLRRTRSTPDFARPRVIV